MDGLFFFTDVQLWISDIPTLVRLLEGSDNPSPNMVSLSAPILSLLLFSFRPMNSQPWREPRSCYLWPVRRDTSTLSPLVNSSLWLQVKRVKPWSKHVWTHRTLRRARTPPWTSAWAPRASRKRISRTRCLSRRAWAKRRWDVNTELRCALRKSYEMKWNKTTSFCLWEATLQLGMPQLNTAFDSRAHFFCSAAAVLESLWLTVLSPMETWLAAWIKNKTHKAGLRVAGEYSGNSLLKRLDSTRENPINQTQEQLWNNLCLKQSLNFCLLNWSPLFWASGWFSAPDLFN